MLKVFIFISLISNAYGDILSLKQQRNISNIMRNDLPQKIGPTTTAVNFYIAGDTMVYTYEAQGILHKSELDTSIIIKRMNNSMCTYPPLRKLIDKGITLKYVYTNKRTKKYIFDFSIDQRTCRQHNI